jgi:signal transduction histidine kinase
MAYDTRPASGTPTAQLPHPQAFQGNAFTRMMRQLGIDSLYSLLALPMAIVSFVLIIVGLTVGAGLLILAVGFPILAATMFIARGLGDLHRVSLAPVVRRPSARPIYPKTADGAGWFRRSINPLLQGQSWLDVAAGILDLPFGIISFVITVTWWSAALGGVSYGLWDWTIYGHSDQPGGLVVDNEPLSQLLGMGATATARISLNTAVGIFFLLTLPVAVRLAALLRAQAARALLCGVAEMRQQITGLQEQKQAAASAEATALRRLERDIHDGPQQRLVRLAMDLGRARQQFDTDPTAARATIEEAIGQTRETLDELRALSRGIAPPILTDRGLPSALAALAGRSPVPVDLAIESGLGRLDAGVETTTYFVVAEALTNVAKHSHAGQCTVTIARGGKLIGIVVADDGIGGASIAKGHGLAGLADRILAAGGKLAVTSPTGGPTEIRVELPCA